MTSQNDLVPDLYVPQFAAPQACEAAEIDFGTFKNWIRTDRSEKSPPTVVLSPEERLEVGGSIRYALSFARVMQLAVTKDLMRLGFKPRPAAALACSFAFVGDGDRPPCTLFPSGLTMLVAIQGEPNAIVRNVMPKTPVTDLLIATRQAQAPSATVLNLNVVDARVRRSLGLDLNWGC